MLLLLNDSIRDVDFGDEEILCHAVENILISEFEGKNVVRCSRSVISHLEMNKDLFSNRARAVINRLGVKFSESYSIVFYINSRIEIDSTIHRPVISEHTIKLPLQLFENRSLSDPAVLLCENLNDCKIYKYCADHYRITNSYKGVRVNTRLRSGGGSTTYQEVENILIHKSEICIVVLDSDKKSPFCSNGDTAQLCLDKNDNSWALKIITTDARELENIVPMPLFYECSDEVVCERLDALAVIKNLDSNIYKYLDIKNNTKFKWVLDNFAKDSDSRNYWVEEINKHNILDNECLGNQECTSVGDCQCVISHGGCNNIASNLLRWLEKTTSHKSNELIDKECEEEWFDIGKYVFEWCCASKGYVS